VRKVQIGFNFIFLSSDFLNFINIKIDHLFTRFTLESNLHASWNGSKERADIYKDGTEVVLILMPAFSATALSPPNALFRAYQDPEDQSVSVGRV
jgi:hypothetical protein